MKSFRLNMTAMLSTVTLVVVMLPSRAGEPSTVDRDARVSIWQQMVDAGSRSSDLRVRIVYSTDGLIVSDGRSVLREIVPVETLVDQARGATDPMVLSLMVRRCAEPRAVAHCDVVDFARRWTVTDTQNQLAWVALAAALGNSGDVDGARSAFRRAGEASMWHEYYPDLTRVLAAAALSSLPGAPRAEVLSVVLAKAMAGLPGGLYLSINEHCKEPTLQEACASIVRTMSRDAGSILTINVASMIARRTTLPRATIAAIQQRTDAVGWGMQSTYDAPRGDEPTDDAQTAEADARTAARLAGMIALGEPGFARKALEQSGLTEGEAAKRQVAALSPEQIARRATDRPYVDTGTGAGR